jgi:hypothetical protein
MEYVNYGGFGYRYNNLTMGVSCQRQAPTRMVDTVQAIEFDLLRIVNAHINDTSQSEESDKGDSPLLTQF